MSLCRVLQCPKTEGSQSISIGQQDMATEIVMPILMARFRAIRTTKNRYQYLLVVTRISKKATEILPVPSAKGVKSNAIHVSFMACMTLSEERVSACRPKP